MSFRDFVAVSMCQHGRWIDDEPDEMGERVCALCEGRVVVVLTEKAFCRTLNQAARLNGSSEPFPDA